MNRSRLENVMRAPTRMEDERGIALMMVMLISFAVGAISVGAALVASNASLINRYNDRQNLLVAAADAALEETRSKLNLGGLAYPDSGYLVVEDAIAITDAMGVVIPDVTRSTYVGPTGITSGQYGVFGSIVTVVDDTFGNRIIRRGEIVQESFAKYAYFTDIEPSNISFGGGDQIQGPVHSNSDIKIYASGASFLGSVATAGIVPTPAHGTFAQGYTEHAPRIEMPETADLNKLSAQATAGSTWFPSSGSGGEGRATLRIEFVAVDLDADGAATGENEGFIRVYRAAANNSNGGRWVVADLPSDYGSNYMRNSLNCGHWEGVPYASEFRVADDHPSPNTSDDWKDAMRGATRRCFLGGADELNGGTGGTFVASDGRGQWLAWPGPVNPAVAAVRPDAAYLFPISRALNPSFKGVIFVDGKVAVSGTLRGQVTLAATDDIIVADDIVYATDPGAGTCADMLGLFSADDIVIADNAINAPVRAYSGTSHRTYDDTSDEFIHAVLLALDIFTVDNYANGPRSAEPCESGSNGRGCIYLTGGIIQRVRGAVGLTNGSGYTKRYGYDQCAQTNAPPYFPTTGHFVRERYYDIDPVGFDLPGYWSMLTPLN